MKAAVYTLNKESPAAQAVRHLAQQHYTLTTHQPDLVFSVGGDGTFFFAERAYPGVPKLLIKESNICKKCQHVALDKIISHLEQRRYRLHTLTKLEAVVGKKKIEAVNDFIIRNKSPQRALRFSVHADGHHYPEVIGDGIVASTPYGSTAYFHSITHHSFSSGIGLAFNNPAEALQPLVLRGDHTIDIGIIREEAYLAADNSPSVVTLKPGTHVRIRKSPHTTSFVILNQH